MLSILALMELDLVLLVADLVVRAATTSVSSCVSSLVAAGRRRVEASLNLCLLLYFELLLPVVDLDLLHLFMEDLIEPIFFVWILNQIWIINEACQDLTAPSGLELIISNIVQAPNNFINEQYPLPL